MSYSAESLNKLITLAKTSNVEASHQVFRVILQLLELQVSPETVYAMLRHICLSKPHSRQAQEQMEIDQSH